MAPVLVVLGKNWHRPPHLSAGSRLNALAAAEIIRRSPHVLVLSGGRTAGPRHPSEAAAMAVYLTQRRAAPRLILEEGSIDTGANATLCRALLGTRPISLLTTAAHAPAALRLFRYAGFPVERLYIAEEIVAARSRHHARWIARYRTSPSVRLEHLAERLRLALLRVDPSGRLLRPLTGVTRGR